MTINIKYPFGLLVLLSCLGAVSGEDASKYEVVAAMPENFPPYYLLEADGRPAGFAIEIMQRLADTAGLELSYVVKSNWKSTMEALRSGEADLIPNLGITPERARLFDFTPPLETFGLGLFVLSVNTDIHGVDDLAGRTVAVVKQNAAVKWLDDFPQVKQRLFDHQEQALFALLAGDVDAFAYPISVTWKMATNIGVDERIRLAGLPVMEVKRAVAVRKGNRELLGRLEQAVRAYSRSERSLDMYARSYSPPELAWTLERILRYGNAMGIILLVAAVFLLLWWRNHGIAKLNHRMEDTLALLEQSREEAGKLRKQLEEKGRSPRNSGAADADSG